MASDDAGAGAGAGAATTRRQSRVVEHRPPSRRLWRGSPIAIDRKYVRHCYLVMDWQPGLGNSLWNVVRSRLSSCCASVRTKGIRPGALLRALYTRRWDFAHHPPIGDSSTQIRNKLGTRAITSHSFLTPIAPYLFPSSPAMVFQKEQNNCAAIWGLGLFPYVYTCGDFRSRITLFGVRVIEPGLPFPCTICSTGVYPRRWFIISENATSVEAFWTTTQCCYRLQVAEERRGGLSGQNPQRLMIKPRLLYVRSISIAKAT